MPVIDGLSSDILAVKQLDSIVGTRPLPTDIIATQQKDNLTITPLVDDNGITVIP